MIAFVRRKGHEIDGLYLVEPDGSNLRRVETGALWLLEPSWSPDGAAIVGVGRTKTWDDPADFIGQLNVLSLDGTRERITEDRASKLRPTWAASGEVVFDRAVGRSGYHLSGVRPDGSGLRQITGPPMPEPAPLQPITSVRGWTAYEPIGGSIDGPMPEAEEAPSVSPDGGTILFVRPTTRAREHASRTGSAHHLWACAADGSDIRQLTDGDVHDMDPAWSPDGTLVAFTRWSEDEPMVPDGFGGADSPVHVFLMRPDGTDVHRLTDEPAGYMDPSWSPDGAAIACSGIGPNGTRIVAVDARTGAVKPVTSPVRDGDYHPAWRPIR